ncbi:unnamed protein product [Linum tenue]|uniref:Fe2OG dioxygenase domain-containing protein n=1 Tax=Linum tenue TaxID=586396 RepID=A0AAV0IGD6_9ROSI|nr:unnamed protein product [Linum tenue]
MSSRRSWTCASSPSIRCQHYSWSFSSKERVKKKKKKECVLRKMEVGGSLPVPNVQQLASSSEGVPVRYIRPELELERVSNDEYDRIPLIDMSKLNDVRDDEAAKLHSACKDWGFFQVINHGVAEEVILKMKADIQGFFSQPLEEKMKYAQLPNGIEGYGQAFVVSEEQKLDWGDMLYINAQPINRRNMRLWPSSLRASLDQYSIELEKVAQSLMISMAKNLGVEPEKLLDLFKEGVQTVRMNYYPPCEQASKVIGIAPHSDGSGLTLLNQVNEVQGLQIKKDGKWVPVDPIPGAFIVNVGDIIEIMSNGVYKSIEHRALVNHKKERLSIAAFHDPNVDAMIGPLPNLHTLDQEKQAPNYKSISHQDFKKLGRKMKLDGKNKGLIQYLKIQTEKEE